MKRIVVVVPLILMFATSCKTFEVSQMVPEKDPISPLLPTLDKTIEDFANSTVGTSQEELNFFTKEVEQNLIDPYGDKVGYVVLKRIRHEVKLGTGYSMLAGFFMGVPLLLGMPMSTPKYEMTYEVRILDGNRKLIGKYENTGTGKSAAALYWGYKMKDSVRKAFTDAWNDTFSKIREDIQADSERLRAALAK